MGMQFFDVAVYAVGAGGVCLAVYRGLQGDNFGAIWSFPQAPESTAAEVVLGAIVGAIAGGVGIAFRRCVNFRIHSSHRLSFWTTLDPATSCPRQHFFPGLWAMHSRAPRGGRRPNVRLPCSVYTPKRFYFVEEMLGGLLGALGLFDPAGCNSRGAIRLTCMGSVLSPRWRPEHPLHRPPGKGKDREEI